MPSNLVPLSQPKFDIPTAQEMREYRAQLKEKKKLKDLKESLEAYPIFENILHTMAHEIVEKFRSTKLFPTMRGPAIVIDLWDGCDDSRVLKLSQLYWSALGEIGLEGDKYDATSTNRINSRRDCKMDTRLSQLDETFTLFLGVVHNVKFDWLCKSGHYPQTPSGYHDILDEHLDELNDARGTFEMVLADSIAQLFENKGYTVYNKVKLVRKRYTRYTAIYEKSCALIIVA